MTAMTAGMVGSQIAFVAPSPAVPWLVISIIVTIAALLLLRYQEHQLAPPRPRPADEVETLRLDSPAVVNLLTNDATPTAAGFRATVIDLAARGWLRILPPDDQGDELARVRPAAAAFEGDTLRPHERLVLQHVMARFTTDRAIPARYLAVDVRGSWWRRFAGLVADDARHAGLVRRRWEPQDLLMPLALWGVAAATWLLARANGDLEVAVIDSVERRILAWATLIAIIVVLVRLVRHLVHPELTHTDDGVEATQEWLAVRHRLVESGFGDVAASALEVGDRRLGYATAMCLADGAAIELPLAREDHFRAWSSVGGRARLVRIRYPMRIGYGMAPFVALAVGIVSCFVGLRARRLFADVAREEAFVSLRERFPEQSWLIADIATTLTFLSWVPIVLGLWVALAGAADGFSTVDRTGMILRARRPAEVSPLPRNVRQFLERDRYSLYIAVDDGSSDTVTAWRTTERNAVPQGANATVKASPVLGHVRRASPVGHRLNE
jgi:hypothetical protein